MIHRTQAQAPSTTMQAAHAVQTWWTSMPVAQRRSYIAIACALLSALMFIGLLPLAEHSWVAALGWPAANLLGWGAYPALVASFAVATLVIAEAFVDRALVRAGWLWCGSIALFLLLTESRVVLGAPLGGALGALGAFVLAKLPNTATQLLIIGGLALDALIAFRISWYEIAHVAQWVMRQPATTPLMPVMTLAPADARALATPSVALPFMRAAAPRAHVTRPTTSTIERRPMTPFIPTGTELDHDGTPDALRVPAYLRRQTIPNAPTPAIVAAVADFVLPPLPALHNPTTEPLTRMPGQPHVRQVTNQHWIPALERTPYASGGATTPRPLRGMPTPVTWSLPPLTLLHEPPEARGGNLREHAEHLAEHIERTLKSFGVEAEVRKSDISVGPTIIRFGVRPEERVRKDDKGRTMLDTLGNPIIVRTRVSRIMNLKDDLALALAVKSMRMEAPVPERPFVGIEIPNVYGRMVTLREMLESREFQDVAAKSKLAVALGRDVAGHVRVGDLAKFPHLLIAGATGAGKSVCLNTIIASLITNATPDEVRLVMIDPKLVELTLYDGIPHLLTPVITEAHRAVVALEEAINEMERRYRLFARLGVKNIEGYATLRAGKQGVGLEQLPRIVIIIDELADLMMVAADAIEKHICRLAQLARATGMHLVVATQRPSVDVITGLIKANIPTRIAFMVASAVDSRTILDYGGAEKLLGKGDMLYLPSDAPKAERIQGAYVADDEVEHLAHFWQHQTRIVGGAPTQWHLSDVADNDDD